MRAAKTTRHTPQWLSKMRGNVLMAKIFGKEQESLSIVQLVKKIQDGQKRIKMPKRVECK